MRPSLLAAPLLFTSATLARPPVKRGQTTDTCANLDVDLVFSDAVVNGKPYVAGHLDVSICVSQVKMFVGHYNVTEAAVKVVGVDKVEAAVIALIKQDGVQCTYPLHAKPAITPKNECNFVCTDGFLAMPPNNPSSCICSPTMKECNDQCVSFGTDCSVKAPPSRRENPPKCATGLTLCGVPDVTSGEGYKCTDVASDSYNCGACVKPSPFSGSPTGGINCHLLPGVDEVSCEDSKCFIHTCKSGFTVSKANDACVQTSIVKAARGVPGTDQVVDAATDRVHAEQLTGAVKPGAKVPRADVSGLGHGVLPNGKVSGPFNVGHRVLAGTKVPRADTTSGLVQDVPANGELSVPPDVMHGVSVGTKVHRASAEDEGNETDVVYDEVE